VEALVATIGARSREEAAQMLLEVDAGVFGDASGIGIDGQQKLLDLLPDPLIAWWDALPWLDLVLHLQLHYLLIPET
jgi:hypothetical protein